MKKNKRSIKHLQNSFYQRNTGYQYLQPKQGRGYGVISVKIQEYIFAIPLHSNIRKEAGFILGTKNGNLTGLDYNKAVIIDDMSDIGRTFKIPKEQLSKIRQNEHKIITQFEKFVIDFIYRIKTNDQNVLNRKYKNSTLHYYADKLSKYTAILSNPLQTITI